MPRPWANFTAGTFAVATAEKIMSITHIGKIGRLPKCTRDELGHRIEDGEQGKELVKWLNGLSGVQKCSKSNSADAPLPNKTFPNGSRPAIQSGCGIRKRSKVGQLTEQAEDLDEADGMEISDLLASLLAAELANWRKICWKRAPTRKNAGSVFVKFFGNSAFAA